MAKLYKELMAIAIPEKAFRNEYISDGAFRLLALMIRFGSEPEYSMLDLQKDLQVSDDILNKYINELLKSEFLTAGTEDDGTIFYNLDYM